MWWVCLGIHRAAARAWSCANTADRLAEKEHVGVDLFAVQEAGPAFHFVSGLDPARNLGDRSGVIRRFLGGEGDAGPVAADDARAPFEETNRGTLYVRLDEAHTRKFQLRDEAIDGGHRDRIDRPGPFVLLDEAVAHAAAAVGEQG